MYHIFKLQQNKWIWNFSFMLSHTVYFAGMMVFTLTSQMYHRISVLVPVLVRVPEYLSTSTSTSTSTMTFELTSTSTVRVPEIQYSSTASTSTPALISDKNPQTVSMRIVMFSSKTTYRRGCQKNLDIYAKSENYSCVNFTAMMWCSVFKLRSNLFALKWTMGIF